MVLEGKHVLIAGGTGNVGRHIVREVLTAGGSVIVPSRSPEKLETLAAVLDPALRSRLVPLTGDITSDADAPRLLEEAGELDGAVATLGRFVVAPKVIDAPRADLGRALDDYVFAHFAAARTLVPAVQRSGGAYVTINGMLAFEPVFPGAGLVSIATAAQAMLARVLMKEHADTAARINEVVVYSSFGRGNDESNLVTGADIGRCVAHLLSDSARSVRGETFHLRSPESIPREARGSELARR